MILRRDAFLITFDLWWFLFILLATTGFNQFQVLNIVAFISLCVVPGFLLLRALKVYLPLWEELALCVPLSLLVVMLAGLAGNELLPALGIPRPLENPYLLGEISIAVVALAFCAWVRSENVLTVQFARWRWRDALWAFAPILLVFMSVAGALELNNNAADFFTMPMLALVACYIVYLFVNSETCGEAVFPTGLFFVALALLLMTSLRGWYITGHDIQREFEVFQITKIAGVWSMANYQDAYNACLSITILPTMFSHLFAMADQYLYKIIFQILFALSAPLVYLLSRKLLSARLALVSTLVFLAFPTFFEDMPFLIRQEVAFLFFGALLWVLFSNVGPRARTTLSFLLAGGLVLSHYSTTYTVIAVFAALIVFYYLARLMPFMRERLLWPQQRVGIFFVVVLTLMSLLWTVAITQTGSSVASVVSQTLSTVLNGFTENTRSVDAVSLLTFSTPPAPTSLEGYTASVADPIRAEDPNAYFSADTYAGYSYPVVPAPTLPLTSVSVALEHLYIVAPNLLFFFGDICAKIFEALAPLGLLFILWRRRKVEGEWFLLSVALLIFIALNILLPVLSTEYGVFRALQQSLFIIAPIMIVGVVELFSFTRFKEAVACGLAVFLFLYASAFLPQFFGGNAPQLHLSNVGFYYEKYYVSAPEVAAAAWLAQEDIAPGSEIEADRFAQNKLDAQLIRSDGDIFPALIKQDAYVYLDSENITLDESSVMYQGTLLTYQYPAAFLDDSKDLVYVNSGAAIYK